VTGLDGGRDHTFRLWLRGGQMDGQGYRE
jgi:hypothetical protein